MHIFHTRNKRKPLDNLSAERARFAHGIARDVFGDSFPLPGTELFRDRRPNELPANWQNPGDLVMPEIRRVASIMAARDREDLT